jgi:hypothetical protein
MPHHCPCFIFPGSTDHTGCNTPHSYTSSTIFDLIKKVVILALRDRVFSALRLDGLDSTCLARLRHNRWAVMTSTRLAFRRVMRSVVVVVVTCLMRPMGAVRVFGCGAVFANNRTIRVFPTPVATTSSRANLGDTVTRYDRVHVVFCQLLNLQVINEVVVLANRRLVTTEETADNRSSFGRGFGGSLGCRRR